ncbi:FkbM family methyltransferase [Sulfitobacter donghicola]|uniref:FkbM family methyltransferase n=1 Tax=Sulfitobacter donghicola DSW-25 = KCTC 12864 = JCM 14565 TaxID=1300350 RepID=A0A073II55_9RHOB|nr:FkbM family methyltransferase [Sulfitobacter donghicola]KEJ89474.1 FkbM family methyltransferase [Sulfitobacter donghicola DSW-25 = KCTC 12864 = JCM 14565]KIN69297.1 Methyltransferase, FkbM family protein [Sulfitobacter donghicola DSW-25 = KCTC 12864 = JCM 14565]
MDGTIQTRDPYVMSKGMKFPKDGHFITGQLRAALRENRYEAKEAQCVLKLVRDEDTVIELGAGIGFMSTLVATRRKIKAVHAFEANPALIPYIRSVHEANELTNAHVTNALLGPRKGSADFYVRNNLLSSSMEPLDSDTPEKVEKVKVEVLNAKQTFKSIGANILIADIEGAEATLLPQLDLTGLRGAMIELHPQYIGPEGVNAVFKAMMDAGLAYYARGSTHKVVCFRRAW